MWSSIRSAADRTTAHIFFFQAEDGIRDYKVTGVQTCALPILRGRLPRLHGAQAAGCAPIVRLVERGGDVLEPEVPQTICRSLAIGSPADGVFAARAMRETGGGGAAGGGPRRGAGGPPLSPGTGAVAETAGGGAAPAARPPARARPGA